MSWAVVEGATENTVVVMIDNLLGSITLPRLYVDGALRRSGCGRRHQGQVHKGRNIIDACPNICTRASRRRSVRPGTRTTQTRPSGSCATWSGVWSMRNRASRAASRGWRILTVIRLGLPHELRRSWSSTVRQVTQRKRWRRRDGAQWTAAGLLEAQKTFRRLKAYRQLPILRNALQEHLRKAQADSAIETHEGSIASSTSDACPTNFNRDRDIAPLHVDGYTVYDALGDPGRVSNPWDLAYCWVHWRRRFVEFQRGTASPVCEEILGRIAALSRIEAMVRGHPPEHRLNSPLKKASLTGFHATAKHIAAKAVSPSSETMRTI